MNRPKVFIASKLPNKVEEYIAEFCDYEKWEGEGTISKEELFQRIQDKEGVLLSGVSINQEFLEHASLLKVVSNVSVGYNKFDIDAMKARKIIGTNTPGVLDSTVADLVLGLMLSPARRIAELDVYEKEPINLDNPLLKMPNVVTVPHIGSATEKTRVDMAMLAAKSLVAALSGEIPPSCVPELRS